MAKRAKRSDEFELVPELGTATNPRGKRDDVKRLIALFHDEHLRRHGIKPLVNGKHASLIGQMAANWGEGVVADLIRDFMAGNDPWAVRCGWTVEALYYVAPRMLTRAQQVDERTASNVDAARRATQRRDS